MEQITDYDVVVEKLSQEVFNEIRPRVSETDLQRVKQAFHLAKEAHAPQRRKSGEPYIIHPISVALITARELRLDANSVITSFLHDVVEDTPYTVEDIRQRFGDDVAGLVDVVTKKKKKNYNTTKQVDNYQQILESLHYDIRAVMVKIADRLHNMRTLESMRPDKQMKIAGETDFFYAPLANRLGLFEVKSDLENLSFKYRCGLEYQDITSWIEEEKAQNADRLNTFCKELKGTLKDHGIQCECKVIYRRPYSIWRRMHEQQVDFFHLPNHYYIRIEFWDDILDQPLTEKETCLKIYNLVTREFRERPGSFINNIDQSKENTYQCLRLMLLSGQGIWEDIQICSQAMVRASQVGCLGEIGNNIGNWVKRFRNVLQDITKLGNGEFFLEHIASSLYYDDITVFSPNGKSMFLPKGSSVIDYAFKQGEFEGNHAHYARVNGKLCSVKTRLNNGDCIELHTSPNAHPEKDWVEHCESYTAKRNLRLFLVSYNIMQGGVSRCPLCHPLPGGDVIGIRTRKSPDDAADYNEIVLHRRSCPEAIRLASKHGDDVVSVTYSQNPSAPPMEVVTETSITINRHGSTYPVTLDILAVDRYHLCMDLLEEIADKLYLVMDHISATSTDNIAHCKITVLVHNVEEMLTAIKHISAIEGVESVTLVE